MLLNFPTCHLLRQWNCLVACLVSGGRRQAGARQEAGRLFPCSQLRLGCAWPGERSPQTEVSKWSRVPAGAQCVPLKSPQCGHPQAGGYPAPSVVHRLAACRAALSVPWSPCQWSQSCSPLSVSVPGRAAALPRLMDELCVGEVPAGPGGAVARCLVAGMARWQCRASLGAALEMSIPQSVGLLRSQHDARRAACGTASPAPPPARAKGSVPAGAGAWQSPAQGSRGDRLGPLSLPSPGHRPSICERGCSSSQALPVPQRWPDPAGASAWSPLWPAGMGMGDGGGFLCLLQRGSLPTLGEGWALLYQHLLSGPCRSLGRATWRRLRRCTRRCTQQGKR